MGIQTTVYKNRGLTFESDINLSNNFYIQKNLAVVHKKPTPIKKIQLLNWLTGISERSSKISPIV